MVTSEIIVVITCLPNSNITAHFAFCTSFLSFFSGGSGHFCCIFLLQNTPLIVWLVVNLSVLTIFLSGKKIICVHIVTLWFTNQFFFCVWLLFFSKSVNHLCHPYGTQTSLGGTQQKKAKKDRLALLVRAGDINWRGTNNNTAREETLGSWSMQTNKQTQTSNQIQRFASLLYSFLSPLPQSFLSSLSSLSFLLWPIRAIRQNFH